MANLVLRDLKKRKLFKNLEPKRILYKSIIQDLSFPKQLRFNSSIELTKLPRNSSLSRIRNRCIKTGRGKAILKKFRLSVGVSRFVRRLKPGRVLWTQFF